MSHSRRTFLRTTGVAAAAIAGSTLFEAGQLFAAPVFTRRDVGGLAATDPIIVGYKKAIQKMKALPITNPLGWGYQAAIHGSTLGAAHPAWSTCEHGTLFFLSWHRMYLYWFERIVRKHSGNAKWALPFWNYESPSQRELPLMFRTPTTGNELFESHRGPGWNDTSSPSFLDDSAVDTSWAFGEVPFASFSSALESTPHAAVHIALDDWMGAFETAALDPIFWLHHCNIDRLWNAWLALKGGRIDPLGGSAADKDWQNRKFLFFDENGSQVMMTGCQILRAQDQLGHRYEGEPAQVNLACKPKIVIPDWLKNLVLELPPFHLPPQPDPPPWEIDVRQVRDRLLTLAKEPSTDVTLDLSVEADVQPKVYYEVYAGAPKDARLDAKSPFYIGNLALFAHGIRGGHQHGELRPAQFSFPLDKALQASQAVRNGEPLRVSFVPRTSGGKNARAVRPNATLSIRASIQQRTLRRTEG